MGEKIIADALDAALARHFEQFGNAEREKTGVVFMDGRWVAIQGGYTLDEIRDALGYIKHSRVTKVPEQALADSSPFSVKNGQVFIKDAFIDNGVASADYSVMVGVKRVGEKYIAGMPFGVENQSTEREKVHAVVSKYLTGEATEYTDELVDELMSQRQPASSDQPKSKPSSVEFKADRFAIHKNAQSVIDNAKATAWRLSDPMHEAILNAVRESDFFKSLVHRLDAQAASIAGLAQVVHSTENAALRSEKPKISDVPAMMAAGCLNVGTKPAPMIEQETLSSVLTNTLHVVPIEKVGDIAIQLSRAVKAAFNELEQEDAAAN